MNNFEKLRLYSERYGCTVRDMEACFTGISRGWWPRDCPGAPNPYYVPGCVFPSSLHFDDLQGVLNGIGEVLQGAGGNGLLRRVLAGAIRLCQEGNNHLHTDLCTQYT